MANDLSAFNSEAWSERLVTKVDQINVMLPLVNRDWEGDLRLNKSVHIRTAGNIAMGPYSRGTIITYQDLVPFAETFTVNDGEYFAFEVDDIDKAQSDINAMDVYMKRAVVSMNNVVEKKLLSAVAVGTPGYNVVAAGSALTPAGGTGATATATITAAGVVNGVSVTAGGSGYSNTYGVILQFNPAADGSGYGWGARATATVAAGAVSTGAATIVSGGYGYLAAPTVTVIDASPIKFTSDSASTLSGSTGIYEGISKASFCLDQLNVPRDGRWLVVDPFLKMLLVNDTAHFVRYGDMGDRVVQTALIGGELVERTAQEAPGFCGEILGFMVYCVPHVPVDAHGCKIIPYGDAEGITYAAQITEIEALRLQNTFANAIRGLLLHDVFVPAEASKRLGYMLADPSQ
jgi:hypothetical protein